MTRETKIGLLVGLAFMIVIGILLQQQAQRSTEPPPAQLPQVTENVMRSVQTGARRGPAVEPAAPVASAPHDVMPMTQDLVRPAPPIRVVIGPSHSTPTITPGTPRDNTGDTTTHTSQAALTPSPTPTDAGAGTDISRIAENNGERLVPIDQPPTNTTTDHPATALATSINKKYVAQAGDTVSRMAGRFMPGGNTNANRTAIIKANAALQKNNDRVIVGQTYIIPLPDNPGMHAGDPVAVTPPATPAAGSPATASDAPAANAGSWYIVKKGDTLSKIAADQLGDANAKSAIVELNRDKIKDEDTIYENMKLKLPGKPLASAQQIAAIIGGNRAEPNMIKLIVCIFALFGLGMLTLQLRQQRLDLNHQCIQLHNQIEGQQAKLWNQQLDIALWTAPNTIAKTVSNHGLKMVPQTPQMPGTVGWIASERGSEE